MIDLLVVTGNAVVAAAVTAPDGCFRPTFIYLPPVTAAATMAAAATTAAFAK